jgi:fructokinase
VDASRFADRVVGAIEAGGTKFQCALVRGADTVLASRRIPTTSPPETLGAVVRFFAEAQAEFAPAEAFGIGTFGPVDLDTGSATHGRILPTPKAGWSGADLRAPLQARFRRPVAIDTDVNAAALAEAAFGAGRALRSLAYVTVGTGIGGGVVLDGQALHGMLHPEMGHIVVRRDPRDLDFAGTCPFHRDCLEGLASGPAVEARWGAPLDALAPEHPAADVIGGYLAQLAVAIVLLIACERIVFGGGVMTNGKVLTHVRRRARELLGGYLPVARVSGDLTDFLVPPGLGERSGLVGAALLAHGLLSRS